MKKANKKLTRRQKIEFLKIIRRIGPKLEKSFRKKVIILDPFKPYLQQFPDTLKVSQVKYFILIKNKGIDAWWEPGLNLEEFRKFLSENSIDLPNLTLFGIDIVINKVLKN